MDLVKLIVESNLVNFVIALIAVIFLLAKILPSATEKRKAEIQKEILAAEQAKKEAEQKLKELAIEIEEAHEESKRIIDAAQKNAEVLKNQTIKDAKLEIERLSANSQKELRVQRETAINTIKEQISHLTIKNVERALIDRKEELDSLIKAKLARDLQKKT